MTNVDGKRQKVRRQQVGNDHHVKRHNETACGTDCKHGQQRKLCEECDGGRVCKHKRPRHQCKDCDGAGICEHGKERHQCKDCDGSGICTHGKAAAAARLVSVSELGG